MFLSRTQLDYFINMVFIFFDGWDRGREVVASLFLALVLKVGLFLEVEQKTTSR